MSEKAILVLDFDGVIHSYSSGWEGASVVSDPPVAGAIVAVLTYLKHYRVAIYSSRSHQWGGKRAMQKWLKKHLIDWVSNNYHKYPEEDFYLIRGPEPTSSESWEQWRRFMEISEFHPGMDPWDVAVSDWADSILRRIMWPWFKPPAFISIDDRAVTFKGTWPTLTELQSFKSWNK